MSEDSVRVVLCAASAYDRKYYFNRQFDRLPENVKEELHILCVLFTEEVGGIFSILFTPEGDVEMETQCDEGDLLYDDISGGLLIKEIRRKKRELFEALSVYYRVAVLKQDPGQLLSETDEDSNEE